METVKTTRTTLTKPMKVLFHSWHFLPHSYGICCAFLLINLHLNYGPNGKIKKNAIEIYVEEAPFFNLNWKKQLVYTEEYNLILKNLKVWDKKEEIDLIYRQTYPYNINITEENKDIPKCIFYTSEFAYLTNNYFSIEKPKEIGPKDYDLYISLFLKEFKNIYFTSPSVWSSRGMIRFLDNVEDSSRNRIVTHGVDTSIFRKNIINRNSIRERYNIKETDILLVNIGAMTTNKGIKLILEVLNIIVNRMGRTEYKLMLKGSGDLYSCKEFLQIYFDEFEKNNVMTFIEIDNLLTKHIVFIDKTISFERINDLFNACDAYISPYLCEGFNLCVLEALSSGLSVLVPKTGSTKEYIDSIYSNGGNESIFYVDSSVTIDQVGLCQNIITIDNLVNTIINSDFKKEKNSYNKMLDFINKELSWNHASTLLYDYFNFIKHEQLGITFE